VATNPTHVALTLALAKHDPAALREQAELARNGAVDV
jgi:hypothetical protein